MRAPTDLSRSLVLALSIVCACAVTTSKKAPVVSDWAQASVPEGRRIYRAVCAGCHGDDGQGNTEVAQRLFPRPRNLAIGAVRFRSTTDDSLPLRSDLLRTLFHGLPGTAMPAWKDQLSTQQLASLVVFVETLSPRFREDPPEADDVIVDLTKVKPPPRTRALLARGRQVYAAQKCSECHGEAGRGNGPAAPTLRNSDGSRAHVFDFTYGIYKGGNSPAEVYRTFLTGLDGTPMPSYADTLTEEKDRWALVYYCLSLSRSRGLWFYLSERPRWQDPALPDPR